MQAVTVSPGFVFATEYNVLPASFAPSCTVPAENAAPDVVAELLNAEKAATPATVPSTPMSVRLRRIFLDVVTVYSFRKRARHV
jgi:hypothetical protein